MGMADDNVYCEVEVSGRRFRVMYETSGNFAGMVHIFDLGMPKHRNMDVVLSGSAFVNGQLVVNDEDIFEPIEGLIRAAEAALSRKLLN